MIPSPPQGVWEIGPFPLRAYALWIILGIVIALFQALTQIQEITLTFVPKILAIFVIIALTASFTGAQVWAFTQEAYARIETGF